MKRRTFVSAALATALLPSCGRDISRESLSDTAVERIASLLTTEMTARHIPGLSAALIQGEKVIWQGNFGYANIGEETPMSERHVQNIASISKTFVAVAVLQQVEAGRLDLDADVNAYLPFSVRNPHHPDVVITTRMLMQHTSSLADGISYAHHYRCGDPPLSLGEWMEAYFSTEGRYFDVDENFLQAVPGEQYSYCNTSIGLLGYLVELASGESLPDYCDTHLFKPLGMQSTAWMIAGVAGKPETIPYTWVEDTTARGPSWGGVPLGVIQADGPTLGRPLDDGFVANCQYNHPNYPDGFLRTSRSDLTRWATFWLGGGKQGGLQLLRPETTRAMFTPVAEDSGAENQQGLVWYTDGIIDGELVWGHSGSDPGVSTSLRLLRGRGIGAVILTNTNGATPADLTLEMLQVAVADQT